MRRMPRTHSLSIALAFGLSLISPGCAPAQVPPVAIDPCGLLTIDEVSAALGQAVQPGRSIDDGVTEEGAYSTTCIWAISLAPDASLDLARPLGGRSFVILNVMNWPRGSGDAQMFIDSFRTAFEAHEIPMEPVTVEVGADESIWWGDGVAARKADVSYGISVAHAGDPAERRSRAESLARGIASRLDRAPT
jgi:hypothetical protein